MRRGLEVGVVEGQKFFLKRRQFLVSFRASFREAWTRGEGCICSAGRWGSQTRKEGRAQRCGFWTMGPRTRMLWEKSRPTRPKDEP